MSAQKLLELSAVQIQLSADIIGTDTRVILDNPYISNHLQARLIVEKLVDLPPQMRNNHACRVKKYVVSNNPGLLPRLNTNNLFYELTQNYRPVCTTVNRGTQVTAVVYGKYRKVAEEVWKLATAEQTIAKRAAAILDLVLVRTPLTERQRCACQTYEGLFDSRQRWGGKYEEKFTGILQMLVQNEQFVEALYQSKKRYNRTHTVYN